eukprot:scaffold59675_cov35-Prasinocladus_malaysianus.AAC.2
MDEKGNHRLASSRAEHQLCGNSPIVNRSQCYINGVHFETYPQVATSGGRNDQKWPIAIRPQSVRQPECRALSGSMPSLTHESNLEYSWQGTEMSCSIHPSGLLVNAEASGRVSNKDPHEQGCAVTAEPYK